MSRLALSMVLFASLMLAGANTALAQGDQPPPPPPLGDAGDEPSGIDTPASPTTAPPPPTAAPRAAAYKGDPEKPVVRATGKNMGIFACFGGLGTMTVSGATSPTSAVLMNQVGVKFVFSEKFMLPVFFGMGIDLTTPGEGESATNWSLEFGAGVEYHFRIWRRISPFVGGQIKFGFSDNADVPKLKEQEKLFFGLSFGPSFGIEYYIADRLSLTAAYLFLFQIGHQDHDSDKVAKTTFGMSTLSGGSLTVTAYF